LVSLNATFFSRQTLPAIFMTRKRRLYIRLLFATPFVIFIIYSVYKISINTHDTNFIPDYKTDYINIFPSTTKKKLEPFGVYVSKLRNDISFFNYDNKYNLVVYKIDLLKDKPLNKVITCRQGTVSMSENEVYIIARGDKFDLKFLTGKSKPVENIIMTIDGITIENSVKSDTLAYYYLNHSGFSLQYINDRPIDIVAGPNKHSILQTSLLFLKRTNAIYMFILSPKIDNLTFDKLLLYKLCTGDSLIKTAGNSGLNFKRANVVKKSLLSLN